MAEGGWTMLAVDSVHWVVAIRASVSWLPNANCHAWSLLMQRRGASASGGSGEGEKGALF